MADEWPTGIGAPDVEAVSAAIVGLIARLHAQTVSFRTAVAGGGVDSLVVHEYYNVLAEALVYVDANAALPGLAEAIQGRFPYTPGFDPERSWPPMRAAVLNLGAWIQAHVEKTVSGRPAFLQWNQAGQLVSFPIPVTGPLQTELLALLDALLLRFV